MHSEHTYTHRDLSKLLGVSETTVKSYRRKFPDCIPVASKGKPIRFTEEAREVCFRIRDFFSAGMSVEEVRERLAKEFSWLKLKTASQRKPREQADISGQQRHMSQAVSDMAKSMLSLSQQQNAVLKRMQGLENLLDEWGLKGAPQAESGATANSLENREVSLTDTLKQLNDLAYGLTGLAGDLSRALGEVVNLNAALAGNLNVLIDILNAEQKAEENQSKARIIPLRPQAQSWSISNQDVPRRLLGLPLVVRRADGTYINAGGHKGRVSMNDLKAMLANALSSPLAYIMRWEQTPEGWWCLLEQLEAPEPYNLRMQVAELVSPKGAAALEVVQLQHNGESALPVELCGFITGIGEE